MQNSMFARIAYVLLAAAIFAPIAIATMGQAAQIV